MHVKGLTSIETKDVCVPYIGVNLNHIGDSECIYFLLRGKKEIKTQRQKRGLKHNTAIGFCDAGVFLTKGMWRGLVITVILGISFNSKKRTRTVMIQQKTARSLVSMTRALL